MQSVKSALPLWPFIVVDVLFFALAGVLLRYGHRPLPWQEAGLLVVCGALGAASFLTPFLRRNADEHSLSHAQMLAEATSQIQKLDELAGQIRGATGQWAELHTHSAASANTVKQVAERMETEAKAFTEFLQKANDSERNHLRLEVEKLRRAETERLQVLVIILDHVFALFQAARHCGQPGLIEQLGQFQNTCRDAARRIGLAQIVPQPGDLFDTKLHQLPEGATAAPEAVISGTLAPGYSYQGQQLRRPLVALPA
jgi:hypothetical protein